MRRKPVDFFATGGNFAAGKESPESGQPFFEIRLPGIIMVEKELTGPLEAIF